MVRNTSFFGALARRCVSVAAVFTALAVVLATAPVVFPVLFVADRLARGKVELVRSVAFIGCYLVLDAAAVVLALLAGLAYPLLGTTRQARRDRSERVHVALQSWWTRTLLAAGRALFRLRIVVTGAEELAKGPMILLMRHSSIGDTVIPSVWVTQEHGIALRYVLKRELLWDPAFDFVGHRIPNFFVDRDARDPRAEIEGVRELTRGLRPNEGVIIYPEGTVFEAGRRAKAIARLEARGDTVHAARARALTNVLPPRVGGTVALLESNPGLDVVLCAHVGFEGAVDFRALITARWLDAVIRIQFIRIPYAEIPRGHHELSELVWSWWERMDHEVGRLHALRGLEPVAELVEEPA